MYDPVATPGFCEWVLGLMASTGLISPPPPTHIHHGMVHGRGQQLISNKSKIAVKAPFRKPRSTNITTHPGWNIILLECWKFYHSLHKICFNAAEFCCHITPEKKKKKKFLRCTAGVDCERIAEAVLKCIICLPLWIWNEGLEIWAWNQARLWSRV